MNRELGYAPHYNDVTPFPEAPRFFAYIYDLSQSFIAAVDPSTGYLTDVTRPYGSEPNPLEIVGFTVFHNNDPHDARIERMEFKRGRVMAWCFSRMEPSGELGFLPVADLREITEVELKNALTNFGLHP